MTTEKFTHSLFETVEYVPLRNTAAAQTNRAALYNLQVMRITEFEFNLSSRTLSRHITCIRGDSS